jgi:putative zinc finger/helix-turn-helix YgiT family protein
MSVLRVIRDGCPHCEAMRDIEVRRELETMTIRGEKVEFESEFMLCMTCGKDFADLDQMDRDLEAAHSVYRARHGIIGPKELVALRATYDISQKAFARILDIGDLTINSYEQGVLPSGAHNSLLKLAAVPENFKRLYDTNKAALTDRQRTKVERALAALGLSESAAMEARESAPAYGVASAPDELRLLELIQLVLASVDYELHKMAVLKLLFYIDFSYYRKTGHSISGWRYARLPYGPVPNDYKDILCKGEEEGFFKIEPDAEEIGELLSLPEEFDADALKASFSPSELEVVELVAAKLGKYSASALRDLSHEEPAWIETANAQEIPYELASSLKHGV